jgi:hypothetical protein
MGLALSDDEDARLRSKLQGNNAKSNKRKKKLLGNQTTFLKKR